MHQPARNTPAADSATPSSSSNGTPLSSQAQMTSGSGALAAPLSSTAVSLTNGSVLEPWQLLSPEEACSCNVLELVPQSVQPLPIQLPAVVANLNGTMSFSLGLHLPGSKVTSIVQVAGGTLKKDQVSWNRSTRMHLSATAVQSLKVNASLAQPADSCSTDELGLKHLHR